MSEMPQNLSPASLVAAIEAQLVALGTRWDARPRVTVHADAEMAWTISDIPLAMFNSVVLTRLAPDRTDAAIRSLVGEAQARQVPLLWWLGPWMRPADLAARLERHGFALADHRAGMALDLARWSADVPPPAGLSLRAADDREGLRMWADVHAAACDWPAVAAETQYAIISTWEPAGFCALVGWLDGQPVATSMVLYAGDVAGVNFVATLPQARRRGIGAAMTAATLRDARERGCRVAALTATDMGAGVYRVLGFKVYCQIAMYMWSPDGGAQS
ncbi:MAG: GNAT family N-acetyltransferase [Anaerolineae bacterium]